MRFLISIIAVSFLILTVSMAATGQKIVNLTQQESPIFVPEVTIPPEALATGLGGNVDVLLRVGPTGKVSDVISVSGPGPVCPSVTRIDVLAIRAEAERVARETTFTPALSDDGQAIEMTTSLTITFDTPRKNNEPANNESFNAASKKEVINREDRFTIEKPPQRMGADGSDKPAAVLGDSRIDGNVVNGRAIFLAKPPYPSAARAVRASGTVIIQVLILEDGTIFSASPISGHPLLRAASKAAACESTFRPVTLSGQPVKITGLITYNFNL